MTPRSARRAGRPTTPVLSPGLIAEAALRLLDENESGDFTMVELAERLGVRPSAIYNHVAGKETVLAHVRELITDRIDVGVFDRLPWDEAVVFWARSYRVAFATHPVTIALFATTHVAGATRTIAMYERVVRAFADAGWPQDRLLTAIVALENFILGSALDKAAPEDILDPQDPAVAPDLAQAFAAQRAEVGSHASDAAFEAGLAAILVGLRAWRDEPRRG